MLANECKTVKRKVKNVDESLDVQIFHDSEYECLKDLTQVYIPDKQDKKIIFILFN